MNQYGRDFAACDNEAHCEDYHRQADPVAARKSLPENKDADNHSRGWFECAEDGRRRRPYALHRFGSAYERHYGRKYGKGEYASPHVPVLRSGEA